MNVSLGRSGSGSVIPQQSDHGTSKESILSLRSQMHHDLYKGVFYGVQPTSDKGWENITDYRQNHEKITD